MNRRNRKEQPRTKNGPWEAARPRKIKDEEFYDEYSLENEDEYSKGKHMVNEAKNAKSQPASKKVQNLGRNIRNQRPRNSHYQEYEQYSEDEENWGETNEPRDKKRANHKGRERIMEEQKKGSEFRPVERRDVRKEWEAANQDRHQSFGRANFSTREDYDYSEDCEEKQPGRRRQFEPEEYGSQESYYSDWSQEPSEDENPKKYKERAEYEPREGRIEKKGKKNAGGYERVGRNEPREWQDGSRKRVQKADVTERREKNKVANRNSKRPVQEEEPEYFEPISKVLRGNNKQEKAEKPIARQFSDSAKENQKNHFPVALEKESEEEIEYVKKEKPYLTKKRVQLSRSDFDPKVEYVAKPIVRTEENIGDLGKTNKEKITKKIIEKPKAGGKDWIYEPKEIIKSEVMDAHPKDHQLQDQEDKMRKSVSFKKEEEVYVKKNEISGKEKEKKEDFLIKTLNEGISKGSEQKSGEDLDCEIIENPVNFKGFKKSQDLVVMNSGTKVSYNNSFGLLNRGKRQLGPGDLGIGAMKGFSKNAISNYIISGGINIDSSQFCAKSSLGAPKEQTHGARSHNGVFSPPVFTYESNQYISQKVETNQFGGPKIGPSNHGLLQMYTMENEKAVEEKSAKKPSLKSKIIQGSKAKNLGDQKGAESTEKTPEKSKMNFSEKEHSDFLKTQSQDGKPARKSMLQVLKETKTKECVSQIPTHLNISSSPATKEKVEPVTQGNAHPETGFSPYKTQMEIEKGLKMHTIFEGTIVFRQNRSTIIRSPQFSFKIVVPGLLFNRAYNKSVVYFEIFSPENMESFLNDLLEGKGPMSWSPFKAKARVVGIKYSDALEYQVALTLEPNTKEKQKTLGKFTGKPLFNKKLPENLDAGNPFEKMTFIEDPKQPPSTYSNQTIFMGALKEWKVDKAFPSVEILSVVPGPSIFERQYNAALLQFQKAKQSVPFQPATISSLKKLVGLHSSEDSGKPKIFEIPESDIEERKDLRTKQVIVLGQRPTGEFDNAISFEKNEEGRYELSIHVSDLSYFCQKCPTLEEDVKEIGTTVCSAVAICPMLPTFFAPYLWSFGPGKTSMAFTIQAFFDKNGTLLAEPCVFQSCVRPCVLLEQKTMEWVYTQRKFDNEIEEQAKKKIKSGENENFSTKKLFKFLWFLQTIGGALKYNREHSIEGNLDIFKPVPSKNIEILPVDDLIAELNILAERTVASFLLQQGPKNCLLFQENPPDQKKIQYFQKIAQYPHFSFFLNRLKESVTKIIQKGNLDARINNLLTSRFLRLRKPGQYVWAPNSRLLNPRRENASKKAQCSSTTLLFWDNCRTYTHFACPTQRYADIFTQISLSHHFSSTLKISSAPPGFASPLKPQLATLSLHLSSKYDRYYSLLKTIRSTKMCQNLRDSKTITSGVVEEIQANQFSIYIPNWDFSKVLQQLIL